MEGLKKRAYAFGLLALLAAGAIAIAPKPTVVVRTEDELVKMAPDQVGEYRFQQGTSVEGQSYKMDERTYETLKPFGIVCRTYSSTAKAFDVVLIASQSDDSFHDPRICFTAQGWTLGDFKEVPIETKTRGTIKAAIAIMSGSDKSVRLAAFFYKGPGGFYGSTNELKLAMFKDQVLGGRKLDGVFYRFMPMYDGATEEDLTQFIAEYMDAAGKSSGNYF